MAARPPATLPAKIGARAANTEIVGQARRLPVQGKGKRERFPYKSPLSGPLFERQLDSLVFARGKMILVDHARAGVPTQQGIVISRGANCFRLFEPIHRFTKSLVRLMATTGRPARELRFGATLCQNSTVIGMLVLAPDSR
jgi:hypothetical protein